MGFLAFLLLGLIAGAIAKLILPGKQGGGWIVTLLLGVIGAVLGGWIGSLIFNVGLNGMLLYDERQDRQFSLYVPAGETAFDIVAFNAQTGRDVTIETSDREPVY